LRAVAFITALAGTSLLSPPAALAQDRVAELEQRIERLEQQNAALLERLETLIGMQDGGVAALRPPEDPGEPVALPGAVPPVVDQRPSEPRPASARRVGQDRGTGLVGTAPTYAYHMLDHAENVNLKPLYQLLARADGALAQPVTLSGAVTVLANYQDSNTPDTFGYLMRHPTGANQAGGTVSEAVIHSAQLAATAQLTSNLTGYFELLYDPQQSFGPGTITAIARNQVQMRRAWLMVGDLEEQPVYALIGKLDVPFGLNETVSPFTNSTNWHAFAGLAFGAMGGVYTEGFHARAMAVQGGAQFRAANAPVNGTAVPSRLNNFALDASYTAPLGDRNEVRLGGSYIHGSAYCQDYPVFHFNPCDDNVPAWAVYGHGRWNGATLLGEFARTTKVWPGSAVPDPANPLSGFEASKVTSFTLGGRYEFGREIASPMRRNIALSAEFSRFIAGDDGAPWEAQSQLVLGASYFVTPSINLFGEYIHVGGFVPLNFVSGGNFADGSTWSTQDANTDVILVGAQAAF
jgi:hypothetical protein